MKPNELPSIEKYLSQAKQQRLRYVRVSIREGNIVRQCGRTTVCSPAGKKLMAYQVVLGPFCVTPVHSYSREVVYVPLHGFADIIVWMGKSEPRRYKIAMGDGCVIVPAGCLHVVETFATPTNRIHAITTSKKVSPPVWESATARLCRGKGDGHWPSVR